ncbi:MAG: DoxX family protein [Methylococcales bacterium]|nr:DoxX family protein [Methylococcales bacterium]
MNKTVSSTDCAVCPMLLTLRALWAMIRKTWRWLNNDAGAYAPLLPRLLLAYEFLEAGREKLSAENWFSELAFPFPFNLLSADVNWELSIGLEIIAPIALILGIATRFFSAALAVLTIVAIAVAHWPGQWQSLAELWRGYAITDQGYGNYKLPLMYLFMLISLLLSGGGRLSMDAWLACRMKQFNDG